MGKLIDLTGRRFTKLVIIERSPNDGIFVMWRCKCDCGGEIIVSRGSLQSKNTRSCGCLHKEMVTTHGMHTTTEHRSWNQMLQRCTNKKNKDYRNYGGRGISVCGRWLKFENFFFDMGLKPTRNHSIDRIENNGNYEPSNCRWATTAEQAKNRRTNRRIAYGDKTMIASDLARELNVDKTTFLNYLKRHTSEETIQHYS